MSDKLTCKQAVPRRWGPALLTLKHLSALLGRGQIPESSLSLLSCLSFFPNDLSLLTFFYWALTSTRPSPRAALPGQLPQPSTANAWPSSEYSRQERKQWKSPLKAPRQKQKWYYCFPVASSLGKCYFHMQNRFIWNRAADLPLLIAPVPQEIPWSMLLRVFVLR